MSQKKVEVRRKKKRRRRMRRRAAQGVEAVLRAQRAKPKEGTGAEAGKGKDGEEAKASEG